MHLKAFLKKNLLVREIVRFKRNSFKPAWSNVRGVRNLKNENLDKGKRILVITGGGGYSAAKQVDSLLATALRLRGASVDVLLCDGILPACFQTTIDWDRNEKTFAARGTTRANCYSCFKNAAKTYSELGLNVIKIGGLVTNSEKQTALDLSNNMDADEIRNFSMEGIEIGEHAYAGALRFYATSNLIDKFSENILRRYLSAAILCKFAANKLHEISDYSHVLLHHGIYVPQGVFAECSLQKNIPTTTWHVAYREKTFLFSHSGTYHKTMLDEPESDWNDFYFTDGKRQQIQKYLANRWSGYNDWVSFSRHFDQRYGQDNNKPVERRYDASILMLTNVMWDAQLHYPANAFPSMLEWIIATINYFKQRPNLQLIIRIHPAEVSGTLPSRQLVQNEIFKYFPELPHNIDVKTPDNPVSTYNLAKNCDSALIYGTKTGVELTAMGIPTIVAGEAWIRGKGITTDVSDPQHYIDVLNMLPFKKRLSQEVQDRALKYAYHFFFRRMIPVSLVKKSAHHEVFGFNFTDLSELKEGSDPGLDVICGGILNGSPYIFDDVKNE